MRDPPSPGDFARYATTDKRKYLFNGVNRDDIQVPRCPAASVTDSNRELVGDDDNCSAETTALGPLPDNADPKIDNAYSEDGKITCNSKDTLDITITDRDQP
jgi:hypothetical protein